MRPHRADETTGRSSVSRVDGRRAGAVATSLIIGLLLAGPASGADPLPSLPLPSLPLPSSSPMPSLPLPSTSPVPSLPLPSTSPVPTLPLPTVTLPSLPAPTPTPTASTPPTAAAPDDVTHPPAPTAGPLSTDSPGGSSEPTSTPTPVPASPTASAAGGLAVARSTPDASPGPADLVAGNAPRGVSEPSPPLAFLLPALLAGIPIAVVALVIIGQILGGAAWLPVVRRWLNRSVIPGRGRGQPWSRQAVNFALPPLDPFASTGWRRAVEGVAHRVRLSRSRNLRRR
jgi:hypothetical protein